MDHYVEQILKVKPGMKQYLMMAGAVLVVVAGAFCLVCVSGSLGLTLIIIGAVLIGFAVNAQKYEYEYAFTNGDCDIAKIINRSNRKDVYTFSEGDVLRVLRFDSDKFQNELEVNNKLVVKDFTSGSREHQDCWYAFMISEKNMTTAVVLELNAKSLKHVQAEFKTKFEE